METINQAANAVRGTIWGNNTTADGQPATRTTGTGAHTEIHKSMIDDSVTETKFNGGLESDPDAEGAYQPKDENDPNRRPQGPESTGGQPQGANVTGDNEGTNKNPFSSSNEPNTGFGGSSGAQPSVTADPNYAQQNTQKHQGGDKPNAEPDQDQHQPSSTGSGNSGVSGGGSMGGGAAGQGGMKLPDSENDSKGEGTGTLYEKSTGLACDGGDFDATRPGAAREAARLMDEKGLKHGGKDGQPGDDEQKEKKWYGVDHSGFGGHGSHKNKRLSFSKSSEDGKDVKSGDESVPRYQPEHELEHETGHKHNDTLEETNEPHTEKKGLAQKIKEKLHHSSS
ncbi:hypothetical protein ABW20_dc0106346 [Dactylellina cionopaga]|nr:hypothetical protein ABW20_dc0106346 [Dactylellina cionopaga]